MGYKKSTKKIAHVPAMGIASACPAKHAVFAKTQGRINCFVLDLKKHPMLYSIRLLVSKKEAV